MKKKKKEYLFDLTEDPDEIVNLIGKNPEILKEFR